MVEKLDAAIPVAARPGRDRLAEPFVVQLAHAASPALAEHRKKIRVLQRLDAGELQFEQRVLAGIHVHGVDMTRPRQRIIQRVAAGRGDHQHVVVRLQAQRHTIEARVLPARVVDQVMAVDQVEDVPAEPFPDGHRALQPPPPSCAPELAFACIVAARQAGARSRDSTGQPFAVDCSRTRGAGILLSRKVKAGVWRKERASLYTGGFNLRLKASGISGARSLAARG